jgi:hypothetical protein
MTYLSDFHIVKYNKCYSTYFRLKSTQYTIGFNSVNFTFFDRNEQLL